MCQVTGYHIRVLILEMDWYGKCSAVAACMALVSTPTVTGWGIGLDYSTFIPVLTRE